MFYVTDKHLNKTKIDSSSELLSVKKETCPYKGNCLFNKDKKNDYENGIYLLRVRQIKCLKKFIKIRAKMIVNVIRYQSLNNNEDEKG